ncbi:MAG: alpha/beta hydrolase family esterase, partial [Chloroflexota bacterium]
MKPLRYLLIVLFVITLAFTNFSSAKALTSSLVEVTGFGDNPSNLRMFVYIPTTVKPNPPILVVVHWCTGSAEAIHAGTQYAALADQYGYMIVYPSATRSGACFDVSTPQALTRGGGSDPVSILSMVTYAAQHYNGDLNQVYVTGISSGAMMTNVLLGLYPDIFKAGAAFAGVPFGCFATTDGSLWNSTCSSGQLIKTPQEWGDLVRNAYPGYSGPRPRMQLWHGTEDTALHYNNFGEAIKQWTNVLGASQTPVSTDHPRANWTRTRYADNTGQVVVEAISEQGVTHSIQVDEAAALHFFGLDGNGTPTATTTATTPVATTPVPTTAVPTTPGAGGCRVSYTANSWSTGFTADIK